MKLLLCTICILFFSINSQAQDSIAHQYVPLKMAEEELNVDPVQVKFRFSPIDIQDALIVEENEKIYYRRYWPQGGIHWQVETKPHFDSLTMFLEDPVTGEKFECNSLTPGFQFHGNYKEWDINGNLIKSYSYKNGEPIKKDKPFDVVMNPVQCDTLSDTLVAEGKTFRHLLYTLDGNLILQGYFAFEDYKLRFIALKENSRGYQRQPEECEPTAVDFFVFDTYRTLSMENGICRDSTDWPIEMKCSYDTKKQLYVIEHHVHWFHPDADKKPIATHTFWVDINGRILHYKSHIDCDKCFFWYQM